MTSTIKTLLSNNSKSIIVDNRYEIKKKIDEGTYAKVYLAHDWQQNGKEVVIKILRQRAYVKAKDKAQIKKEIDNHAKLNHQNVIRMQGHGLKAPMCIKGVLDTERTFVYLTTEYLGRDYINFYDLIKNSTGQGFGENAGRFFLLQMLDALEYLHNQAGVVHRDLKLENILIDKNVNFKLIDFGLSDSGNLKCLQGAVGSPSYVAPEVLEHATYDGSKVDIFSMGVLLFIIVQGQFPHGTKILKDKYYAMIKNRQYEAYFNAVDSQGLSSEFKDLIVRLLDYVPSKRPSIAQIRQHTYLLGA